jgi:hypothetical protein
MVLAGQEGHASAVTLLLRNGVNRRLINKRRETSKDVVLQAG